MKTENEYEYKTKGILLCSAECITRCKKNNRFFIYHKEKYDNSTHILRGSRNGKYNYIHEYIFYDFSKECPAYDVEPIHIDEAEELEILTGLDINHVD